MNNVADYGTRFMLWVPQSALSDSTSVTINSEPRVYAKA